MDHQHIFLFGGLTLALLATVYILWGPSTYGKRRKGKIVGLVNLGSTCFVNTLLQALASCALFVEWLDLQKSDEKPLTSALQNVLWVLNGQSEEDSHSPEAVLNVLRRHGWVVPAGEQDAHELFHCIISTLQEENKRVRLAGSLSDALPASDTLSQASDILEDPFEGGGDAAGSPSPPASEMSGKTIYDDALSSNKGDSDSQSGGINFYSVDSGGTVNDNSDETLKFNSPQRSNLTRVNMEKLRSSQESIRRGIFDRTGCPSPTFPVTESPPFQGLLASTLQCHSCGNASSVRTDTFDSLSLSLGESAVPVRHSLPDLLRQFVRTEIIPDVECEKCGKKTNALKTFNFGKLPPSLCLHVSRTSWQASSRTPSKRDDHVEFPEYLVMDPFTWKPGSGPSETPPPLSAKHLYRLKSVVVHVGSANSGHFLTYRRGPLLSNFRHGKKEKTGNYTDSSRWYMASDENVQLSSMCRAMDSLAYILFYEKCNLALTGDFKI